MLETFAPLFNDDRAQIVLLPTCSKYWRALTFGYNLILALAELHNVGTPVILLSKMAGPPVASLLSGLLKNNSKLVEHSFRPEGLMPPDSPILKSYILLL